MRSFILKLKIGVLSLMAPIAFLKAEQITVACEDPEKTGLYEQCQEVVLLEPPLGDRIRVYSKPEQKVLTLRPKNIFTAITPAKAQKFRSQQFIAVPARYLWNNSKVGFQSICQVESEQGANLLVVSCGRHQKEKILKNAVFSLQPFLPLQESQNRFKSTASN